MEELLAISGPTASGKSDLALRLAELLDGEVVSVDSMQLYRQLNIGVAKLPESERRAIKHHLLDELDVSERSDVYGYLKLAEAAIEDIQSRGKKVILCGGSGFYLKSLLYGIAELPGDAELRRELDELSDEEILTRLKAGGDVESVARWQDCRRKLARALEVLILSGTPIGELQRKSGKMKLRYPVRHFTLEWDAPDLKRRIMERTMKMLDFGWIEEAKQCLKAGLLGTPTAYQAIGYRQIGDFLAGRISREELADSISACTWRFARRQRTWFRHQHPEAEVITPGTTDTIEDLAKLIIKKLGMNI